MSAARVFGVVLALLVAAGAAMAMDRAEALKTLDQAKREAGSPERQALALARIAWFDTSRPHVLRHLARQQLVGFGDKAHDAIRELIRSAPPLQSADMTVASVEASRYGRKGRHRGYLPMLESALWDGTIEARRIAMLNLQPYAYAPAVLPVTDTGLEYPPLERLAVETLTLFRNDNATRYMGHVLRTSDEETRRAAARGLAFIGGKARRGLLSHVTGDDPLARTLAADALVPIATVDDLGALRDYLEAAGSGAPADVLDRVRSRVAALEDQVREELLRDLEEDAEDKDPESAGEGDPDPA